MFFIGYAWAKMNAHQYFSAETVPRYVCQAISKKGESCKEKAVRGGLCEYHHHRFLRKTRKQKPELQKN